MTPGALSEYIHLKDVLYAGGAERFEPVTSWRIRKMEAVSMEAEVEDALRRVSALAPISQGSLARTKRSRVLFLERYS